MSRILTVILFGGIAIAGTGIAEEDIVDMAFGADHACVLSRSHIHCAGDNSYGQIGQISTFKNARQISLGWNHTCVLDDDGVWCWGDNSQGQIEVPNLIRPTMVAAGAKVTCAIDAEKIRCWGSNERGQLDVPEMNGATYVSVGDYYACAIDSAGLKCWGTPRFGNVGSVPEGIQNPKWVKTTGNTACALSDNGIVCWGDTREIRQLPGKKFSPNQISASGSTYCGIETKVRKLACWGDTLVPDLFGRVRKPKMVAVGWQKRCLLQGEEIYCNGTTRAGEFHLPLKLGK